MDENMLKTIAATPLFQGLGPVYIKELGGIAADQNYSKGEMIFSEGDPGTGFYVVKDGKVKIFKLSFGGKEQILHIYGPGKPFGEVPVFAGKNFPASAMALQNSSLLFFPRNDFISLIEKNPSLSLNMLSVLSMRLREFTVMVENLSLKDVPARIASYILLLAREKGSAGHLARGKGSAGQERHGSGTVCITLPVSKNQLAGLLGTTPETISRIFARFAGDDLITVDRSVITILDMEGLAEAAETGGI
ncbi:MAG: Crp/Fnr family transcriptional regulator [Desulfamplus sp.]|nr:Crp/Fnr family transcriptional regulator [Desulfamplus sp.]